MSNIKHNWKVYKVQFIHHNPPITLAEFARELGISKGLLNEHANKDGWVAERDAMLAERENDIIENTRALAISASEKNIKRIDNIITTWLENFEGNEGPDMIAQLSTRDLERLAKIKETLAPSKFKAGKVNLNISRNIDEVSDEELQDNIGGFNG